ncbi:MAG: NAD-dependent epimerase/dehydratase family protein [bacterium]
MRKKVIVITGAAGFIGSALTVALAPEYLVVAIDRRKPGGKLLTATPGVQWEQSDISDAADVKSLFHRVLAAHGRIDFVLHLAAFYHFGTAWLPAYQRTNVEGTANLVRAAIDYRARRFIFASSIAAMAPPPPGRLLTEASPTSDFIPYAKSKAIGEQIVVREAGVLPAIVARIAGVFSDWCELPPLYSLIKIWSGPQPMRRIVLGSGKTGMPFIHRKDVVRFFLRCMEMHEKLDSLEILLASQPGTVAHRQLYDRLQQIITGEVSAAPLFIKPGLARMGLFFRQALQSLLREPAFEQAWMLKYVDRPWAVDNSRTCKKLNWCCSHGLSILDRIPEILRRFADERSIWIARNNKRMQGEYDYVEDSA